MRLGAPGYSCRLPMRDRKTNLTSDRSNLLLSRRKVKKYECSVTATHLVIIVLGTGYSTSKLHWTRLH